MKDRIFTDDDFDGMLYDVHRKPSGLDLLEVYPDLRKMETFVDYNKQKFEKPELFIFDLNKVIKYIVYCYDAHSPILKRFLADAEKRKTTAAHYAGFEYDAKGYFGPEVDTMMKCRNNHVNKMIIDYVRQFNDPEYGLLITGYENYWQKLQQISEIQIDKDDAKKDKWTIEKTKGELFTQAQKMAASLGEMTTKILRDDNKNLSKEFYSFLDANVRNRLKITPEQLAGIAD